MFRNLLSALLGSTLLLSLVAGCGEKPTPAYTYPEGTRPMPGSAGTGGAPKGAAKEAPAEKPADESKEAPAPKTDETPPKPSPQSK